MLFTNRFIRRQEEAEVAPAGGGGGETAAAPAADSSSVPPPLISGEGKFSENWHTALGDDFAPHAAQLATFKDVGALAKSYIHLRGTGPAYPGEGSSPEEVSRFHALAKVPVEGTPTAYGLTLPENASDADKATYDRIAKVAHANHLSGPGFAAVVAEFQKAQADEVQGYKDQIAAAQKAAEDDLVSAWRGDYEANKSTVRHVAEKFAGMAGLAPDDPNVAGMLGNPAFAKLMLQVSKGFSEDGIRPPAGFGDVRSPQQKADAIMAGTDPVWGAKYTGGNREDQLAAYNEVSRLMGQANK